MSAPSATKRVKKVCRLYLTELVGDIIKGLVDYGGKFTKEDAREAAADELTDQDVDAAWEFAKRQYDGIKTWAKNRPEPI